MGRPPFHLMTAVVLAVIFVVVCGASTETLPSFSFPFWPVAAAAGRPIRVALIGPFYDDIRGALECMTDGLNAAFHRYNTVDGGALDYLTNTSRPIELITFNFTSSNYTAPSINALDGWMANESTTGIDVLGAIVDRPHMDALAVSAAKYRLLMLGPSAGDRKDYLAPTKEMALTYPSPDAELTALLRELLHARPVRRVAIMTSYGVEYGNDLVPFMQSSLAEFGISIVYHFIINDPDPSRSIVNQLLDASSNQNIQALLVYGHVYPETGEALGLFMTLMPPTVTILAPFIATFLVAAVLSSTRVPSQKKAPGHFVVSLYGPLYNDTRFAVVRDYHRDFAALEATNATFHTTAFLRANSVLATFGTMGFVMGRLLVDIIRSVAPRPITGETLLNATFSSRLIPAGDVVFGPYSRPCEGMRTLGCGCQSGSRTVQLATISNTFSLVPLMDAYALPLGTCSPVGVSLRAPRRHRIAAATDADRVTTAEYLAGTTMGGMVVSSSSSSSTATASDDKRVVLRSVKLFGESAVSNASVFVAEERDVIITSLLGSVMSAETLASYADFKAEVPVNVDPVVKGPPRLHGALGTTSERILHLQATLDQEIHALTKHFGSRGGMSLVAGVETNEQKTAATSVADAIRASLRTHHQTEAHFRGRVGGEHSNISVAQLLETVVEPPSSTRALFLHGVNAADISAIRDFLARYPSAQVLLPFHHVRLLYAALVATIVDPAQRRRVAFASSLPNWNPTLTTPNAALLNSTALRVTAASPLMRAFWQASNSSSGTPPPTPQSLSGFIAERFASNIADRIPALLTGTTFLSMVYAVTVVILEQDLITMGPFRRNSTRCQLAQPVPDDDICGSNVGARTVHVYTLEQVTADYSQLAMPIDTALVPVAPVTFAAAAVRYEGLPVPEALNPWIIGVSAMGGVFLLSILCIVLWFWCRHHLRHMRAPKDPTKPLTIVFTDIQSSTTLWAEIPDIMGPALETHNTIIRKAIQQHRGYEIKTIGDAFMVAFCAAEDAVAFADAVQHALLRSPDFPAAIDDTYQMLMQSDKSPRNAPLKSPKNAAADAKKAAEQQCWRGLRVRIGIHTGAADIQHDIRTDRFDYYGPVVNTAARVESAGHGGQVLLTEATLQSLSTPVVMLPLHPAEHHAPQTEESPLYSSSASTTTGSGPWYCYAHGPANLRGVQTLVPLFELVSIRGRCFPPLKAVQPQENKASSQTGDGSGVQEAPSPSSVSLAHSLHGSEHLALSLGLRSPTHSTTHTTSDSRSADRIPTIHILATIEAFVAVLPPTQRRQEVRRLCKLWHVVVPSTAAVPCSTAALAIARGDAEAGAALDALCRRLGPVASRQLHIAAEAEPTERVAAMDLSGQGEDGAQAHSFVPNFQDPALIDAHPLE